MKLKRLKRSFKAPSWKKGQSSSDKPTQKKFRSAVNLKMMPKIPQGDNALTKEAVTAHEKALDEVSQNLVTLKVDAEDYESRASTFKTFATNFTTCTLPAFDRFFEQSSKDSPLHLKMLSIIAATEEKVTEKFSESNSSYMFYLMEALKGVEDSEDDVLATISLISRVITKTGQGFLNANFASYSKLLEDIFTRYEASSNALKLIPCLMGCISTLLRAANVELWKDSYTMSLLKRILDFVTHANRRVRKQAQYNVAAILQGSHFMVPPKEKEEATLEKSTSSKFVLHPASDFVAKFVAIELKSARLSINALSALYLVDFLKLSLPTFSAQSQEAVFGEILATMKVADERLNAASLRTLAALVTTDKPTDVTKTLLLRMFSELGNADFICSGNPMAGVEQAKQCKLWIKTVSSIVIKLCKTNNAVGLTKLCVWTNTIVPYWKRDSEMIQNQVSDSIEELLECCLKPLDVRMSMHSQEISQIVETVFTGISLQYNDAWSHVFRTIGKCFEVVGPLMSSLMAQKLLQLAYLQNTVDSKHRASLDHMLGAAVRALGPELVLQTIPFSISKDIRKDEKFFWMLPLLKTNIRNGKLQTFHDYFVCLAIRCSKLVQEQIQSGAQDSIVTKTYKIIKCQIWSLFPAFAKYGTDIDSTMGNAMFAKLLGEHVSEDSDVRMDIMAGLRHLVDRCDKHKSPMIKYAKNFVPILMKVFCTKPHNEKTLLPDEVSIIPGHRFAAINTLQEYLKIAPKDLISHFYEQLLLDFEQSGSNYFTQKCDFHLLKLLLPYLDYAQLSQLFSKIQGIICSKKEKTIQKVSYRVLSGFASIEQCRSFTQAEIGRIFGAMIEAHSHTVSNAVGARLECLASLLPHLPKDPGSDMPDISIYKGFWLEALHCCGRNSPSAVRNAAMALFKKIVDVVHATNQDNKVNSVKGICINTLSFVGDDPQSSSNAIIALAFCTYEFQKSFDKDILDRLMDTIVPCLKNTRVEAKSALDFIRLAFGLFPVPVMSDYVDKTVNTLATMDPQCRDAFRLLIKYLLCTLCRKFSCERIKGLVPENAIVMKKVLSNVVKAESAKKQQQKTKKEAKSKKVNTEGSNANSLEEILDQIVEDIEGDPDKNTDSQPKSILKKGIYINEKEDEIVDLLDPNASKFMSTKEPKKVQIAQPESAEENLGFQTDVETGKFIIEDSDDEKPTSRKRSGKLGQMQQILDDDEQEAKKTLKRKRSELLDYDEAEGGWCDQDTDSEEEEEEIVPEKPKKKTKMQYGAEFKATKAKGDSHKRNLPAPYAYVPFNKSSLNKRKRAKAAGQFKNLVKGCQKGARKGSHQKNKKC